MNIDLSKLSTISLMTLLMVFFATISPGALFIFIFSKELFLELDTFKLILLSFGLTSPFWIINTIPYLYWENAPSNQKNTDSPFIACLSGGLWTLPVVYSPLVLFLFLELTTRNAFIIMFILEIIILLSIFIIERKLNDNN
jgi:hypothetical protein